MTERQRGRERGYFTFHVLVDILEECFIVNLIIELILKRIKMI